MRSSSDKHASETPTRRGTTFLGSAGRVALVALALVMGLVIGAAVMLAVASVAPLPPLFLSVGLVAYLAVALGGVALAARSLALPRRGKTRRVGGSIVALVALATGAALLAPLDDPRLSAASVPGQQFWDLPTGSRVAYLRIPAAGTTRPAPVIFLHGGPGVPQMAADAPFFGQLAGDGYDVYLYDQIGAGLSARLADPARYTLARAVDDLEAVRREIGAERVILIGHSWGGTVAASYLARFPAHVERVIFSSPGALYPPDWPGAGTGMLARLTDAERRKVYATLAPPRALLAYALVQVSPLAAHAYAGDAEMDARFDTLFARVAPGLVCDSRALPPEPIHGLGFYANQVPQAAGSLPLTDPRPALRTLVTPVLVLKGACDYLPWGLTAEYRDVLPSATLVYLADAGHQAYEDEPGAYLAAVRAFLRDLPPPIPPYTNRDPPPDYIGTR